jgi:asparagine synthase (glutamine-hydrolysing)
VILGGVVYRDHARRAEPEIIRAMMSGVPDATEPLVAAAGPAILFVAGHGKRPRTQDSIILAADLDLLNLEELRALTGVEGKHEVLAQLYHLEGWKGLRRLRGAFAVALWDSRQRQLLLAVDQLGIRRLHYVTTPSAFAFASRPAVLVGVPEVARRADPSAVYLYLNFGFVPAPFSIFEGVQRIPPGHVLFVKDGSPTLEPYWDARYTESRAALRDASAACADQVGQAVTRALAGTKPKETGAFLSGGTDSSTVVGLMARLTGERVNAFSIGFREPHYDELHYAEVAARHFNATHYTRVVTADDALGALPKLVGAYDEPFGNDSAIGTYFCATMAREAGVSRLLAGDGGDEIFGGNERYRTDQLFARYQWIPRGLRRHLLEPVLLGLPDGGAGLLGKAQRYVQRANVPNPRRFFLYEFFFAQEGRELLDPEFLSQIDVEAPWLLADAHFRRPQASSDLNRLLYLDLKLAIGDNDLLKVTRTADLANVGVRFPLLDLTLGEHTMTWPAHLKVRGLSKRYLFKRTFRDLLPAEIMAKRKHGFGVPTALWLKTHPGFTALAHDVLLAPRARQRGYLRRGAIEELLARHRSDTTSYYGDALWTLLMLELWHCHHLDSGGRA